jgi:hypothetical protein
MSLLAMPLRADSDFASARNRQRTAHVGICGRRAVATLIADHADVAAYDIVQVCAWRGEVDCAFEWLERAYAQRDSGMPLLATDRFFVPLHDDPRWNPLLRKAGLVS